MKNRDKVTLTFKQLRQLVNESKQIKLNEREFKKSQFKDSKLLDSLVIWLYQNGFGNDLERFIDFVSNSDFVNSDYYATRIINMKSYSKKDSSYVLNREDIEATYIDYRDIITMLKTLNKEKLQEIVDTEGEAFLPMAKQKFPNIGHAKHQTDIEIAKGGLQIARRLLKGERVYDLLHGDFFKIAPTDWLFRDWGVF